VKFSHLVSWLCVPQCLIPCYKLSKPEQEPPAWEFFPVLALISGNKAVHFDASFLGSSVEDSLIPSDVFLARQSSLKCLGGRPGNVGFCYSWWGWFSLSPLGTEEKKVQQTVYGCQSISGLTSTIALAVASSSLQVSMTVLLHIAYCQTHCSQTRPLLWCRSEIVQSGYFENHPKYLSLEFTNW